MVMNVLSLFDGCSGGQVALQKLGITFDRRQLLLCKSRLTSMLSRLHKLTFLIPIQLGDVTDVEPMRYRCWRL